MPRQYSLVVYESADRLWRWRLESPHGDVLAESGKGYAHDTNLYRALGKVVRALVGKSYRKRRIDYVP